MPGAPLPQVATTKLLPDIARCFIGGKAAGLEKKIPRTSPVVQRLGLHILNAGVMDWIPMPGQGTKIPRATWHGKKKNEWKRITDHWEISQVSIEKKLWQINVSSFVRIPWMVNQNNAIIYIYLH